MSKALLVERLGSYGVKPEFRVTELKNGDMVCGQVFMGAESALKWLHDNAIAERAKADASAVEIRRQAEKSIELLMRNEAGLQDAFARAMEEVGRLV